MVRLNCLGVDIQSVQTVHQSMLQCSTLHFYSFCRYIQAELVHSRFAMAAVAGILIPEVRGQANALLLLIAWLQQAHVLQELCACEF